MSETVRDSGVVEASAEPVLIELEAAVGAENVVTDTGIRRLQSQDVYRAGKLPLAVVRPKCTDETSAVVAAATAAGLAVFVRGGGMSYTDAFLPDRARAIVLDMTRMNRVREINATDLYVTVEAGCSWAALDEALAPQGLRSVFWGPMSGQISTVGGAMAQGAVTFGSARHGPSSANALSIEVVLADGSILHTGSDAQAGRAPFFRHYGPDMTGLFTGDAGALGVKTAVTLQLERRPGFGDGLSFAFADFDALVASIAAVCQRGLATEVFGAETELIRMAAGDANLRQDLKTLWAVGRAAHNPLAGFKRMVRVAMGGRRFLADARFTVSFLTEAADTRRLSLNLRDIRNVVGGKGQEIINTMAAVTRAVPFPDPMVLGPGGRRLLPLHTVVPWSAARALHAGFVELLKREQATLKAHDIDVFVVYSSSGLSGFLYECVIYWRDEWLALHRQTLPTGILAQMQESEPQPAVSAAVEQLRVQIIDLMDAHGGAHFQIGRAYPYTRQRDERLLGLLSRLKHQVDPQGLLNPGALGLKPHPS